MKRKAAVWIAAAVAVAACSGSNERDDAAPANQAPQPAAAQGLGDISAYRLAMSDIDKLHQAQVFIGLAVRQMTEAEREAIKDRSKPSATLDDMVANIESNKPYNDAIVSAGLTAREYVTIMLAMMQTSMAESVFRARPGVNQDSLAREMRVNMDNIEFMRANQTELARKQARTAAEMKRMGISE